MLLKAAKDVLLLGIFGLFLLDALRGRPILCDPLLLGMSAILVISFLMTAHEHGPILALAGLRGLSPFLLAFVAYSYLDLRHIRSVVKVLVFLLLVEFCAACVRARYGAAVHGFTFLRLAARPCGTFIAPSSWSIFLCFILCYLVGFDIQRFGRPRRSTWFLAGICAFLVLLSGSGAGILALATAAVCWFLFFTRVSSHLKAAVLPTIMLSSLGVWTLMPILTRRPRVFDSADSRLRILADIFLSCSPKELLLGRGLGIGSNVAVTLVRLDSLAFDVGGEVFIADSLYGSLMAQMGILFLLTFVFFNGWLFQKALVARRCGVNPIVLLAVPVVLVGALGNVTTEVFPVNWLLFILYGIALKPFGEGVREGISCSTTSRSSFLEASECR
jgi:hypothetical protein